MKKIVITQTDGVIIMIPVGITELEGAVLPDDVVIPVELVGNRIPSLVVVANVPVVIKEMVDTTVLLETREYRHK